VHHLTRTLLAALAGACAALAALAAFTLYQPSIIIDMDVDLPRAVTAGFYPVERTPDETFVWTTPLATVTLRGIDRGAEWTCTTRLRGARPAALPRGQVALGADGVTLATHTAGDGYEEVAVTVPPRPGGASASLTISTTPPYIPPNDPRELGVMVDEIRCAPAGRWITPASGALATAGFAGAVFGALFSFAFATTLPLAAAVLLFSAGMGLLLTTGVAAYLRAYLDWILPTVLWTAGAAAVIGTAAARRHRVLHPAAWCVLAFSSAALCLKILALLHPSKEVVDAIFQAHRLGAVLGGNYYFTQAMPGGVQFPYAIGLYVAAAPWASLIRDHVALLRIVVSVAEAVAAAMLYVAVVRAWGDRLVGAVAVVLYHAAPLSYVITGNANLTFAFGQSIAVIAVAGATIWTGGRRWLPGGLALFAVASLAFLSHVGVFPLVGLSLFATGVLYAALGGADLRVSSRVILGASVLAALFAVGSYYAHFPEVYRTLDRVSGSAAQAPATGARPSAAPLPVGARAARAARIANDAYGPALLVLTVIGGVLVSRRRRDRVTLALAGWGISFLMFLAFRVLAPVDAPFQRYADEFIHRVYGMTLPAVAIVAAYAAAWAWRKNVAWRVAAGAVVCAAVVIGITQWMAWFR
jgi:hypothetical protein